MSLMSLLRMARRVASCRFLFSCLAILGAPNGRRQQGISPLSDHYAARWRVSSHGVFWVSCGSHREHRNRNRFHRTTNFPGFRKHSSFAENVPYTGLGTPSSRKSNRRKETSPMFASIRSRVLAACVAIVVCSLVVNAALNYFVVSSYGNDSINNNLIALANGHNAGIGDWVAGKTAAVHSLQCIALETELFPTFKRVMSPGGSVKISAASSAKTAKCYAPTSVTSRY